jgi:hypothetical protein
MSMTVKNLGIGQVSDVQSIVLAGSVTKSTWVENITLVNTHTSAVTVNFWLQTADPAGVIPITRLICQKDLSIAANAIVTIASDLTLSSKTAIGATSATPDQILAQASLAGKIDYVISGMERDL